MTSYTRTTTLSASTPMPATKSQLSVLAQAKPAIISSNSSSNNHNIPTGVLSEKLNTTLRFSANTLASQDAANKLNGFERRSMHIEDDNIIQKQNASNQMRQAAVIAAVASQQKVRLSASERLAMTAIRPTTTQQSQQQQSKQSTLMTNANHQHQQQQQQQTFTNTKPTPLPTLETLLAVQRQLKQHTKQNLTSAVPQQVVNKQQHQESPPSSASLAPSKSASTPTATATVMTTTSSNQRNKPLPPSPPKSPPPPPLMATKQQVNHVTSIQDTYDKDLPPLPSSISPCNSTDDSQLNSLESHQSSPATSLVSLPPPPPPLSAYLQQYDEVSGSCQQSNNSTSSSPSLASSTEVSSVKHYPTIPVRPLQSQQQSIITQKQQQQQHLQKISSLDSPLPHISPPNQYKNRPLQHNYTQKSNQQQHNQLHEQQQRNRLQTIAPKLKNLVPDQQCQQAHYTQFSLGRERINDFLKNSEKLSPQPPPPVKINLQTHCQPKSQIQAQPQIQSISQNQNKTIPQAYNLATHVPQINYHQHLFTQQAVSSSAPFQPPPPPPLPLTDQTDVDGFDQLDSGNFRFPTPPPPDLLLDHEDSDEEEEKKEKEGFDEVDYKNGDVEDKDDDFQCRIPTPPLHKSMSSASFQDLKSVRRNIKHSAPQIFSSSTFSVPIAANIPQPPPLFRQKDNIEPLNNNKSPTASPPSQLTVHINNGAGLLSTANSNHHTSVNHHHMMMTMTASSSSPSSSSDGDGQSSNSSSSTSGIHSSIDSPSSSNSKLEDFSFSGIKLLNTNKKLMRSSADLPTNNLNNKNGSKYNSGSIINDDHNHRCHHHQQQHQLHPESFQHHKNISALGPPPPVSSGMMLSNSSVSNSNSSIATITSSNTPPVTGSSNGITTVTARRPALKQKKSVSFSDKVELVACAEEQSEDHLPNPLLARVLAGKLQ